MYPEFKQYRSLRSGGALAALLFIAGCALDHDPMASGDRGQANNPNSVYSTCPAQESDQDCRDRLLSRPRTVGSGVDRTPGLLFEDHFLEEKFLNEYREDRVDVRRSRLDYYNSTALENTVYMQGSGRRRLYDVNIVLRLLYQQRLLHKQLGDLSDLFEQALFIDIGSAILFQDGAPTVRDVFEDPYLSAHIANIIATDINDYERAGTQYINVYRSQGEGLPFPVLEISKSITSMHEVDWLINQHVDRLNQPVILRSINTGPDLFYYKDEVVAHLRTLLAANLNRNLLYFFRTYILLKPANANRFQIVGRLDSQPWYQYHWYTSFDWDGGRLPIDALHEYDCCLEIIAPESSTADYKRE